MYIEITSIETHKTQKFYEISEIELRGSNKIPTRELNLTYLDSYLLKQNIKIEVGDKIKLLTYDGVVVYSGRVFKKKSKLSEITSQITCFDNGYYLTKNKVIKSFSKKMPSEILKNVCKDFNLSVGTIPADSLKCSYNSISKSAYDTILTAYFMQYKAIPLTTRKAYLISCDSGGNIQVLEQEQEASIVLENILSDTNFEESIADIVNQVVIYKKAKDGSASEFLKQQDSDSVQKYGIFQDVLAYDEGTNNGLKAKEMFKKVSETCTISVKGDARLRTGQMIIISIALDQTNYFSEKLNGLFYIVSDNHRISANSYVVDLELSFDKEMTQIEVDQKKKQLSDKKPQDLTWFKKDYGGSGNAIE